MRSLILALAIAIVPAAGHAQERALHWNELAVKAHLDAGGKLHVEETHAMVFSGDWNGGERVFDVRSGQILKFEGMARRDPATGAETTLSRGSLSDVDRYAWHDRKTLRWRSRLPDDPPFNETPITYVLRYTLSNILQREGEQYLLDHDFAFPDRVGPIERFSLELTLDPSW